MYVYIHAHTQIYINTLYAHANMGVALFCSVLLCVFQPHLMVPETQQKCISAPLDGPRNTAKDGKTFDILLTHTHFSVCVYVSRITQKKMHEWGRDTQRETAKGRERDRVNQERERERERGREGVEIQNSDI